MSIKVTLKHNDNRPITLDLEEYLNNFSAFVDAIYQELETTTPLNVNNFEIIDTNYFNSFYEIEKFLSINFPDNYNFPQSFLAWVHHYNEPFDNYSKFQSVYRGVFQETKDFAREFIKHNTQLDNLPSFVVDAIDWQQVWDNELSNSHKAIKVEIDNFDSASIYVYAIFQI